MSALCRVDRNASALIGRGAEPYPRRRLPRIVGREPADAAADASVSPTRHNQERRPGPPLRSSLLVKQGSNRKLALSARIEASASTLDDKDAAFKFLKKAHEEKSLEISWHLKADLRIDTLRSDIPAIRACFAVWDCKSMRKRDSKGAGRGDLLSLFGTRFLIPF
jgi:hypothetical protein